MKQQKKPFHCSHAVSSHHSCMLMETFCRLLQCVHNTMLKSTACIHHLAHAPRNHSFCCMCQVTDFGHHSPVQPQSLQGCTLFDPYWFPAAQKCHSAGSRNGVLQDSTRTESISKQASGEDSSWGTQIMPW